MRFPWFASLILLCLTACTHQGSNPEPPPPGPDTSVNGAVYMLSDSKIRKLSCDNGTMVWQTPVTNLVRSMDAPMQIDSGVLYHGNFSGLTAYNASTGAVIWSYSWLAYSDAPAYQRPVFRDSLIYLTSPTSAWESAYLHCISRRTGLRKWRVQIDDYGWTSSAAFFAAPLIYNDQLILVTRNSSGQRQLSAFSMANGQRTWNTVNATVASRLQLINGLVYSTDGANASCFNASTGALQWQAAVPLPVASGGAFADGNDLVLVRWGSGNLQSVRINQQSGALSPVTTMPEPADYHWGVTFRNGVVYSSRLRGDTLRVAAYNIGSMIRKWEYRYSGSVIGSSVPVASSRYVVLPINCPVNGSNVGDSRMLFLNLDGNPMRQVAFQGTNLYRYAFVDSNVVYRESY